MGMKRSCHPNWLQQMLNLTLIVPPPHLQMRISIQSGPDACLHHVTVSIPVWEIHFLQIHLLWTLPCRKLCIRSALIIYLWAWRMSHQLEQVQQISCPVRKFWFTLARQTWNFPKVRSCCPSAMTNGWLWRWIRAGNTKLWTCHFLFFWLGCIWLQTVNLIWCFEHQ